MKVNVKMNEKGSALLITLFILLLFMVLGFTVMTYTMQSVQNRATAEDEIQGRMLAEMGLAYFQEHLEQTLKYSDVKSDLHSPSDNDAVIRAMQDIADQVASLGDFSSQEKYQQHPLPGREARFDIAFFVEKTISAQDETNDLYSRPYVRKVVVSVIGVPPRVAGGITHKRVRLQADLYMNTIESPFHYAVSTPGELRLFGGTNIIGNVAASRVVTGTSYRYSELNADQTREWFVVDDTINKPYIEGTVFIDSDHLYSYTLDSTLDKTEPAAEPQFSTSASANKVPTDRSSLRSSLLFSPKGNPAEDAVQLNADLAKPYLPGWEPPNVQSLTQGHRGLSVQVKERVKERLQNAGPATFSVDASTHLSFQEGSDDGFTLVSYSDTAPLVIRSTVDQVMDPLPLTVRLTGDKLSSTHQLLIGPVNNYDTVQTSVEMGTVRAFYSEDTPGKQTSENQVPFTFNGTIYIKGNLAIVGDINVKGTIYVDGDVIIREISNLEDHNLAIIASGEIVLTDRHRNTGPTDWEAMKPLSAFLYTEKEINMYSHNSFNYISGGIATGNSGSYIEFNTKRENVDNGYASRFTVRFNRGIFEAESPGLPSAEEFFFDTYISDFTVLPSSP